MATEQQKIDLNEASTEELEAIEGFDTQRARAVVEYREEHGPFASWEEVEEVPGVGHSLLQRLRMSVTLEAQGEEAQDEEQDQEQNQEQYDDQAEQASGQSDELDEEDAGAQEIDEQTVEQTMLTALQALAEMDLGAAAAYEIAAGSFEDDPEVSQKLLSFRDDHLRHVDELERLTSDLGGDLLDRGAADDSVLARLAEAADALGPRAALLAMLSNEQLTNGTYAAVLELDWYEDVAPVLERNFQDEQRHLRWLERYRDRLAQAEQQPSAS
jgi:competence ComEA-like helix-hairpin-helix protein